MKMSRSKIQILIFGFCLSGLTLLSLLQCRIDHGLEPIHSKIGGKIFFQGDVPPSTDEVRIAVAEAFPPQHINQLLFSDQIPYREDTARWEIYLPEGTYELVAVLWKEHNQPWNISNIIGIYGGTFVGDFLVPTRKPVTVPNASACIDTIDMEANFTRVQRDGTIQGTITFLGTWPPNTGAVGIGAFTSVPEQGDLEDYLMKNVALEYNIPTFVEKTDYELKVRSSLEIKYIAVLWINNAFDLGSLRDIGFYRDPQDSTQPGTVIVPPHSTVAGIHILVNFSGAEEP